MRRKSTVEQRGGEKLHGKIEKSKAKWKSERPKYLTRETSQVPTIEEKPTYKVREARYFKEKA